MRQVLDDQDDVDEESVSGQYGPTADYGDDHSDRPIDGLAGPDPLSGGSCGVVRRRCW